jgi:hypothetical protein
MSVLYNCLHSFTFSKHMSFFVILSSLSQNGWSYFLDNLQVKIVSNLLVWTALEHNFMYASTLEPLLSDPLLLDPFVCEGVLKEQGVPMNICLCLLHSWCHLTSRYTFVVQCTVPITTVPWITTSTTQRTSKYITATLCKLLKPYSSSMLYF